MEGWSFGGPGESGPCRHIPSETRAVALDWLARLPRRSSYGRSRHMLPSPPLQPPDVGPPLGRAELGQFGTFLIEQARLWVVAGR